MKILRRLLPVTLLCFGATSAGAAVPGETPRVRITTNVGVIEIELDEKRAPLTTANFLSYVDAGFYDGTIFHRVIPKFMIQGGGFTPGMQPKSTRPPVRNEAANGLKNRAGTIAMARTADPHSATAQFFINVADNAFLDHREPTSAGWGYAVFGRVTKGMDIAERIAAVPTTSVGPHGDVPKEPIVIKKVERIRPAG